MTTDEVWRVHRRWGLARNGIAAACEAVVIVVVVLASAAQVRVRCEQARCKTRRCIACGYTMGCVRVCNEAAVGCRERRERGIAQGVCVERVLAMIC